MPAPRRAALLVLAVLLGAAVLLVPTAPASASGIVRWENRVSDRILDIGISSPNLEGPDWSVKVVRLLLPPGWSKDANRTWPTIWVLHGGFDDHKSWSDKGDLTTLTAGKDAIFVLPETSWCSAYSDWRNNGNGGPPAWEKYLLGDVRTVLESTYRANTTRAVAGNSMGGLGAMKFAAKNQGFFRSAASFSGNVDPLHESGAPGDPDLPGQGCAADWKRVWGELPAQRDVWQANNPYSQVARLTGIPLFVSYGKGDAVEEKVYEQNYRFVDALQDAHAQVDERYVSGQGHNWNAWKIQMGDALPMLLSSVGA
ncbi:alpha/beta hydrolase [Nocardia asteroides]|uniref:alpha/beta hydrolase n=1 Tax=Nocardia asteroides TaxID=1824 RepID=UPI001E601603|nr:alpha/beta hydrolase family protein [Nocardia asteroides]UGT62313.1 esterase family protein [Nocardia asteroides]